VIDYENKISHVSQELMVKNENLTKADAFIKELTQKLQNAEKNISQSQSSVQQFEMEVKTVISQYEQNLQVSSHENT
jgi:chromosome segregation ATPase